MPPELVGCALCRLSVPTERYKSNGGQSARLCEFCAGSLAANTLFDRSANFLVCHTILYAANRIFRELRALRRELRREKRA